jgi:hypothetical protein
MKKKLMKLLPLLAAILTIGACSYDEDLEVCQVSVKLVYPENSISPYAGARVEMKDAKAYIFTANTDASGIAHFTLPPGIYEATSNEQYVDSTTNTWWRYIFNGVRSLIIISPDSTNQVAVDLKMSKKRIVH